MIETLTCEACGEVFAPYIVRPQFACPECDHQHEVPKAHRDFLARQQKWSPDTLLSLCQVCQNPMFYQECPTGGWWIHVQHADDDHDAR